MNLSRRELDVIYLRASGLKQWEVGNRLGIAEDTVRIHLANAREKLAALSESTHVSATSCNYAALAAVL